jgi:hypothetical protein
MCADMRMPAVMGGPETVDTRMAAVIGDVHIGA